MQADFTGERLNTEATLYRGCSGKELRLLAMGLFASLVLFFMVLTGIIFGGSFMLGFLLAFISTPLFFMVAIKRLQLLKLGKPDGYYELYAHYQLTKLGLPSSFLKRSGYWSVERDDATVA